MRTFDSALLADDEQRRVGEHILTMEEFESIQPLFDWLCPEHQDVFVLRHFGMMKQTQISQVTGEAQPVVYYQLKCCEKYLNRIKRRFDLFPSFLEWLESEQENYPSQFIDVFIALFFAGSTGKIMEVTGISCGCWNYKELVTMMEERGDVVGLALFKEVFETPLKRGRAMNPAKRRTKKSSRRVLKKKKCPSSGQTDISPA